MRLDRAISMSLLRPFGHLRSFGSGVRIPILMYHSISDEIGSRHPYYETNTSPRVFRQQMDYLHQNGYSTIAPEDAVHALNSNTALAKSVVLTFDDGYHDFYTEAWPILREYKMKATIFIVTGFTSDGSSFKGKDCLSWNQLKELHSAGIDVGSHTESHPELRFMNPVQINGEIGRSKQTIEQRIGAPVRSFSYPYAFPESNPWLRSFLRQTLEKHAYENGVSTILGTARRSSDRFFLPRIPVNTWDDLAFFEAKLNGAYDWLHFPQSLLKSARARTGSRATQNVFREEKLRSEARGSKSGKRRNESDGRTAGQG